MPVRTYRSPVTTQVSDVPVSPQADVAGCRAVAQELSRAGLLDLQTGATGTGTPPTAITWRIAASPFWLSEAEAAFFEQLGIHLQRFYQATNQLYHASRKEQQPAWVCRYFDQGKPDEMIALGRMNRFKSQLPGVIRPDMIPTESGLAITELDAVPGGIGLTAALGRVYSDVGAIHELPLQKFEIIGGPDGMLAGFAAMIHATLARRQAHADVGAVREPPLLAIIVSEESKDYRAEMAWLAAQLPRFGVRAAMLSPEEVRFTEQQLECDIDGRSHRIDVLYRFFELFDVNNIPKAELFLYSAKKGLVTMTPPPKTYLEEKLLFALLHHPALHTFWEGALPADTLALLRQLVPPTWILDPHPLPPHAVIPDLSIDERPVTSWDQLARASQKGRRMVIKPSGFSPLAWGSRGVVVGHDLPQDAWAEALKQALAGFNETPYVLQPFVSGRSYRMDYWDPQSDRLVELQGRVRLSPYYFTAHDEVRLGGILATLCPMDKKLLHGMSEAILAPCAVRSRDDR